MRHGRGGEGAVIKWSGQGGKGRERWRERKRGPREERKGEGVEMEA